MTRRRHPFQGQWLAVLGGMRRHGELELLVVLPDGSKTLMPAGWTDASAAPEHETEAGPGTLGALGDLLHAVAVVAALRPGGGPGRGRG